MYLVSPTSEGIYIKKRFNTIKAALQEGDNNNNNNNNYYNYNNTNTNK